MQNAVNPIVDSHNFQTEKENDEKDIIKSLMHALPLIQQLVPLDCMIGLTDNKKFLKQINGEKIKSPSDIVGQDVSEQDAIYQAMKTGKPVFMIVPEESIGIKFRASAVPIKDGKGKVIGGLGMGFDLTSSGKLADISHLVASSTQQSSAVIEELAASAGELAMHNISLQSLTKQIIEQIENTGKILALINDIANTSKILGLNASIEAARAGDAGKGFTVVAKEIGKMADSSVNSVREIEKILDTIQNVIKEVGIKVDETVNISQQQAAATEEMSSTMQELTSFTSELENAASKVIG